ncbi:hypothetical protein FOA52_012947 [Chlamydomonas sp. UWO 241]|nr:hypothetical protein FOA52_012947 [Chlamydomonas sp. UWO 241]
MHAVTSLSTASHMDGYMRRVAECNTGLEELPTLTPFAISGQAVGQLKPKFVEHLARFPDVFSVSGPVGPSGQVTLVAGLDSVDKRTAAVAGVMETLRSEGVITGWRDELYPVTSNFYDDPVMLLERAAAVSFGIKAYGVHINGYVETADRGLCVWVAKRSMAKPNWPGKLDHIVAGGQPHGISVMDNVVKECQEEASMPAELARSATPVGCVSYMTISSVGLKPDVLFVFDLKLPESFVPAPQDGEVEHFTLMPVADVAQLVSQTTEFKINCNLVIVDFMLRHGLIAPDAPGYLALCKAMRAGECS